MITKIISGGQIGADIAGLRAAQHLGLQTGGWLPKGCMTKAGPRPDLLRTFSMQESGVPGYAERTKLNVLGSDGTVRFAYNWSSYGELATSREIRVYMKPHLDVGLVQVLDCYQLLDLNSSIRFKEWVQGQQIKVLNVARNADSRIEEVVERFLVNALGGD